MFDTVESGGIHVPLWDPATLQDPTMTNPKFLRQYVITLLGSAFPNLTK
jgi:exportin-1